MTYTKQTWLNGAPGGTPRSATRFNHMEDGIQDASDRLDTVEPDITALETALASVGATGADPLFIPQASMGKFYGQLARRQVAPCRVVVLGDSVIAGVGATTVENRAINRLARQLQAAYPSGLGTESAGITVAAGAAAPSSATGVHLYNGAVSGSTSANYCDSTMVGNVGTLNPALVIHMVGINDQGDGVAPATFKSNLLGRIAALKTGITTPCVHLLIRGYRRPDVTSPAYPDAQYVQAMREVAVADPNNVAFLDVSAPWASVGVPGSDPLGLLFDTIHPSNPGQAFMADLLARALRVGDGVGLDVQARNTATVGFIGSDTFSRYDGPLGTAESGQVWEQQVGAFNVSGQKATSTANSVALIPVGTGDMTVSCFITVAAGGAPGVVFRASDANTRLECRLDATAGFLLTRVLSGSLTTIATRLQAFTSGQTYHVRVVCSGSTVTAFLDGVLMLVLNLSVTTQATFGGLTKAGLRQPTAQAGITWSNMTVTRSVTDGGGIVPLSGQTAAYTLALSDAGKAVEMDSVTAQTVTVPTNATVPFPVGTVVELAQINTGQITVSPAAGVTLQAPGGALKTRAQYSTVSLRKRAADVWLLGGDATT